MECKVGHSISEREGELVEDSKEKDWISEVRTLLSEKMLITVDSPDMNLLEAGLLDSLVIVELLGDFEHQFGITVPMKEVNIQDFSSVARIAQLLRSSNVAPS